MMNGMKKMIKRTLAAVLTMAMVLAMLPAGPVRVFAVATALTDPNLRYFTGDNFNDATVFKDNWNIDPTTVADQWEISDKYPTTWERKSLAAQLKAALATVEGYDENASYFDEREGTGNKFLAFRDFNNGKPNNTSATPVNWSVGNKPLEYEFDFRVPFGNIANGTMPEVCIPLAMSGENKTAYFALNVGKPDSGHGYTSHLSIIPSGVGGVSRTPTGNGSKLIVPAWGEGNNQVYASGYSWTHIKAVYDYSRWTDAAKIVAITVQATVVKTTTTNKGKLNLAGTETYTISKTYTVTFPADTETITIGFVPGSSSGHMNIDNLTVKSTAQEAQEFYNTYNTFLSQDPATMTNANFGAFTAMYNAWAALNAQSKAMLAGSGITQNLVDSFANAFASLCGNLATDDFESAFKTENWWNNVDGTVAQVTNTYQSASNSTVTENGNSFLKITNASNAAGKWITPKNWETGERPTKLSFKFRREYSNSNSAVLWFAYDPANSQGAGLYEWNDGGTNQPTIKFVSTGTTTNSPSDNSAKLLSHQNAHNNYVTTYDQWITIEAVYDWSTFDTDGKLKITYSIPEIGGEAVSLKPQTAIYTFTTYGADAKLYPAFYTSGSAFDIDNVVIETNAQAARDFRDTYGAFLAKESVTAADLNGYLAAYDAYNALDPSVHTFLTAEKEKLDAFKSQFDALYADDKLSEMEFDSGFIADQFFETTGGSVSYADGKVQIPNGVSYALKSGRLESDPLKSMEFTFCYPAGNSDLVLFTEGDNKVWVSFADQLIRVYANDGIAQNPNDNGAKLLSCETGMSIDYVGRNTKKAAVWDKSKMITLTANYDYSQWDSNIIQVSFDIKFWGYNFDFDEQGLPKDMTNASDTYTLGWVEQKNIQTITFTVSNAADVNFEPKFVSSGTTQVDRISATYQDVAMETLLAKINDLTVTPATFDELKDLKQQYVASGKAYAAVEEALAAKQAAADALHPTTLGGTIKVTDNVRKQNLMILSKAPTASVPEGFTVSRVGVLFLPQAMLTGELTVDTPAVANGSLATANVPAQFSGELNKSAMNEAWCGVEFATRCYVVYTDGITEYYVYGQTITRSIYGIAKEIANAVLERALSDAEYSATVTYTDAVREGTVKVESVANEDVLAFITANVSAVNALS